MQLVPAFMQKTKTLLEQSLFTKPSLVEVSVSGGVMVQDWDHVSYFTFFFSCQSFWLQLAPLVLASNILMKGEVLVEANIIVLQIATSDQAQGTSQTFE